MISRLYARQDVPIFLPLKRLSSPIGLHTFRPLPPPQSGRPGSSPLEGRPQGSPPFPTRILPRASTKPYFHIVSPPPLLRLTPPSHSLPILTIFLSVRKKSRSHFRNPLTLPLQALIRSLTTYRSRFTDHVPPSSPNSSPLYCTTDTTRPP